jgi:hypothetical protein
MTSREASGENRGRNTVRPSKRKQLTKPAQATQLAADPTRSTDSAVSDGA